MSEGNRHAIAGSIVGLVALICTAVFLLIGFTSHVWHPTWLVFLAIPIASTLTDALIKRKGACAAVKGVVSLLATVAFLVLGFEYHLWHPGWLVFFAIPIADILLKLFSSASSANSGGSAKSCDDNCGGDTGAGNDSKD
jgi:hypothetical protein